MKKKLQKMQGEITNLKKDHESTEGESSMNDSVDSDIKRYKRISKR